MLRTITLVLTLSALALISCKKKGPAIPDCDTTECCELFQQEVFEDCTAEQDKVYGCGKNAKHAYEACIDQL